MNRIGIIPGPHPSGGGIFQYSLRLLHELAILAKRREDEEYVLFQCFCPQTFAAIFHPPRRTLAPLYPPPRLSERITWNILKWGYRLGFLKEIPSTDRVQNRSKQAAWFRHHRLDWCLYTFPWDFAIKAGFPFGMPIHDLQHRLHPEFPEVSADGEWERREYLYQNVARHALIVLVDSEVGREDVLDFYGKEGITPSQVHVLPYLPPPFLYPPPPQEQIEEISQSVRAQYALPGRFFFYPAQFWPHKNHLRLVEAIGLLKERHREIALVLTGSKEGPLREKTYNEVVSRIHDLHLQDRIRYLGYVSDEEMVGLYGAARALAFPTFFGPTNIPILEAWAYGCAVLTSDIRGIREQVGDAALLAAPSSVEALAEGLERLWIDDALVQQLIQKGRERLAAYTPEMFRTRLAAAIDEANRRVEEIR